MYSCIAPTIDWMSPKRRVKAMATQRVYHCVPSRRSFHHWDKVDGRDSSNSSFRITSRSCQYLYVSIRLCAEPQLSTLWSRSSNWSCLLYHFLQARSPCGKRRASVARVSSMNRVGKNDDLGKDTQLVRPARREGTHTVVDFAGTTRDGRP